MRYRTQICSFKLISTINKDRVERNLNYVDRMK